MEELTKRVEELEKRVQHLEAMLRYQARKINEFCCHMASIISYMESTKWVPSDEEREVMEAVWM